MPKPILLVIASVGFQPIEYQNTKHALEAAGIQVVTASNKAGKAISKDNSSVPVDLAVANAKATDYDGIFLIGGPGALEHLDNQKTISLLKEAAQHKIPHGAICISPRILAKAGLLRNIRATGWNEDNELPAIFQKYGVILVKEPVITDGIVVTATDPRAATAFGEAIARVVINYRKK